MDKDKAIKRAISRAMTIGDFKEALSMLGDNDTKLLFTGDNGYIELVEGCKGTIPSFENCAFLTFSKINEEEL